VGNQDVKMSRTVEASAKPFATGSGRDSSEGENDFVAAADLTTPEEVVVADLTDSEDASMRHGK
jgi:hypothetical protein